MSQDLIATRRVKYPSGSNGKEYGTGDAFKALSESDAKVLVAVGRARYAETSEGIAPLRAEYEKVAGKRPFHGWSEQTLREKIGTYRTTHMTAQK